MTVDLMAGEGEKISVELDIDGVLALLPHRYPFLMVDRVVKVDTQETFAHAQKMVSVNEPYFPGHFPGMPVMPGVMQLEALAQVGAIYILHSHPEIKTKAIYLMSMDNCRFRKPVKPGSVLDLHVNLVQARHARLIYKFSGVASVDGEVTSQADFTAMGVPEDA